MRHRENEDGFALVAALLCLVVLSMIGIAAMNTSNIEKEISHNINLAEKTFYGADGGIEAAIEMIEWNVACPLGFVNQGVLAEGALDPLNTFYPMRGVEVTDHKLAWREFVTDIPGGPPDANSVPADGARSMRIPENMGILLANRDAAPHTNIAIFGTTGWGEGGGPPTGMAQGYDGAPRSAGAGGSGVGYEVHSQKIGQSNSQTALRLGWWHRNGTEGECRPY